MTTLTVFPLPILADLLGFGQRHEPMHVQTFRSQRAVERLHVCVVRRLPWPREVDLHAVVVRTGLPSLHLGPPTLRYFRNEEFVGW
jgi:hypothetical protein